MFDVFQILIDNNNQKVFNALGNNRPEILIWLEDQVLHAIIDISEGKPREDAMSTLYSQIRSKEKELADDDAALNWFNLHTTPSSKTTTPEIFSTPLGIDDPSSSV